MMEFTLKEEVPSKDQQTIPDPNSLNLKVVSLRQGVRQDQ